MEETRERLPAAVAHPRAAQAIECRSTARHCALDRLPPRTPGYADAQVPARPRADTRHGAIAHYWFRLPGDDGDVGFGLRDIEIAVTPDGPDQAQVELYCVGDGFQAGQGAARGHAIPIDLCAGGGVLARIDWHFPDVLDGHADPISARWRIALGAAAVASLDALVLGAAQAFTLVSTDPLPR